MADGAVCTALTVLLLIMTLYVPAFAMLAVMVAGLPMTFLTVRDGLKATAVAAVASVLVMGIVAGDFLSALMLGTVNLLPGVAIGYAIRRRKGFKETVAVSGGAVLLGLLLQMLIINAGSGGNGIVAMIDSAIEGSKQMLSDIMNQFGMAEQEAMRSAAEKMTQSLTLVRELLLLYLPSMLIGISAALGYGAVAFAIFMLRRVQKLKIPYLPFSQMHAPRAICYLSMLLAVIGLLSQDVTVYTAAWKNLALLTDCFIGVCGLALIDDKLSQKVSSGYARTGIYAAVLMVGYLAIGLIAEILVFLGMLDGLFHFRRFHKVGEGHGENK